MNNSEVFCFLCLRCVITRYDRTRGISNPPIAWSIAVFFVISMIVSGVRFKLPRPRIIGVPAAPKLTAVVFAITERTTARNGANPIDTRRGAAKAAGVPNPARPSIRDPKSQAINIACILASGEIEERRF